MLKDNKEKNIISKKVYKINQYRSERKNEPTQPFIYFKTTAQNLQSINATHHIPKNTTQTKTNVISKNSGKDYTSITRRGNEGIGANIKLQTTNNFRALNNYEKNIPSSRDIDHKKYGIRPRHNQPETPLLNSNRYGKDTITIKKQTNNIDHKNYGIRQKFYQTATTPFYNPNNLEKDKNKIKGGSNVLSNITKITGNYARNIQNSLNKPINNTNSSKNIFISGSSQSNFFYSNQDNLNKILRNKPNNKNNEITNITSNKRSELDNNQFTTIVITNPSAKVSPTSAIRNNIYSHSINELKKSPKKIMF